MPEQRHVYVTVHGLAVIRTRLDAARAAFKAVCDDNPAARESGDSSVWHDNFAFEENQRLMHQLAARIRDLEGELADAVVVPMPTEPPTRAVIGARVVYVVEAEVTPRVCVLVGHGEGSPAARCVAYDSPLGASLLGAAVGDEVDLVSAGRTRVATIVGIEVSDPETLGAGVASGHPASS